MLARATLCQTCDVHTRRMVRLLIARLCVHRLPCSASSICVRCLAQRKRGIQCLQSSMTCAIICWAKSYTDRCAGRATKLTAPNGLPGQITLVRSPNAVKRALQLTEPHQQHQQQPHQQQKQQQPQQKQQQSTDQQQHQQATKGQRSQRGRKTKVPAVAQVIADSTDVADIARDVLNATDMSHTKDADVSHGAQGDAGSNTIIMSQL